MTVQQSSVRATVGKAIRKNIVVCSDGTGNTAIKGRGTNVFKLFEAVDLHGHKTNAEFEPQIAIYDDGVGTESAKLLKMMGGAFGWGLSRNVKKLYKELARVYDPGDRIFLFGFSRGAFTVRTLAGMILTCGIVDVRRTATNAELDAAVEDAYAAYRAKYQSWLTAAFGRLRGSDRDDAAAADRRRDDAVAALHGKYARRTRDGAEGEAFHRDVGIRFVGVWDTVDAVGLPFPISDWFNRRIYQFKFSTTDLSDRVEFAAHALSVDDDRSAFTPVVWSKDRAEQVWFAGVHSNVGGGYPKQGMSLVALEWLLQKARDCGLHVQQLDLDIVRGHASVDDMMYDPRAGLGVFYHWAPRRISALCAPTGVPANIHVSVLERLANGTADYAPGNLPFDATVVPTLTGDPLGDRFAMRRAKAAEAVLADAGRARTDAAGRLRPDLLHEVQSAIRIGNVSYWIFVASVPALLLGPAALLAYVAGWSWGWPVVGFFAALGGLAIAWRLSDHADSMMDATFSASWHRIRRDLRAAFREAREREREELAPPPPPAAPLRIGDPPPAT
jgi:uncharacterized protein (DUF2235 family)